MQANDIFGHRKTSLNCRGRLVRIDVPMIMGILNLTPDSFHDGGAYDSPQAALDQAGRMISEGADFIDIGGMSTRPGAGTISSAEEMDRIGEVLESVRSEFPDTLISVDTVHAATAKAVAAAGADIINDISAGRMDPEMFDAVAASGLPYVLMHMQGEPANMQQHPHYFNVLTEVVDFLQDRINALRSMGVADIIIDPGFGFGKKIEHNYLLLKHLDYFKILECPILAGVSRKSMVTRLLEVDAADAQNGTTALHMLALQNGADILRVHDVREAAEAIRIFQFYREQQMENY